MVEPLPGGSGGSDSRVRASGWQESARCVPAIAARESEQIVRGTVCSLSAGGEEVGVGEQDEAEGEWDPADAVELQVVDEVLGDQQAQSDGRDEEAAEAQAF